MHKLLNLNKRSGRSERVSERKRNACETVCVVKGSSRIFGIKDLKSQIVWTSGCIVHEALQILIEDILSSQRNIRRMEAEK